ncbi:hypothetical protein ACOSP7_015135 [Xanthoceras sorbifolium]
MEAEEIARLCESLSLSEEDGPILQIGGELHQEGIREVELCLVGKVLAKRKVNREAFRAVIHQIWNTLGGVEIEAIGENLFVFHFNLLEDRAMVWSRGPWHFDNCLIILEKPLGPGEISKLEFKRVEFWVQIFNVPLMCMNMKSARLLAGMIGDVVEIPVEVRECWGRFLRVKVGIDISKPLKRGLRVYLEEFDSLIVAPIRYERLPEFCYGCGEVGHSLRDCSVEETRTKILAGGGAKFGSWMKATPPVCVRGFKQRDEGLGKRNSGDSKVGGREEVAEEGSEGGSLEIKSREGKNAGGERGMSSSTMNQVVVDNFGKNKGVVGDISGTQKALKNSALSFRLDHIKMFVLDEADEADEMLSRGFKDQVLF